MPIATALLGPRGPEYRRDDNTWADPAHPVLGHKARWYLYDGLGSVLGEVDEQGNIVDKYGNPTPLRTYDVYGFVRNSAGVGPTDTDHKFVGSLGHTSEDNTCLIYMRARYYDPAIGRFVSEDPARDGGSWFAYCTSCPTSYIDRNGRTCTIIEVGETTTAEEGLQGMIGAGFLQGIKFELMDAAEIMGEIQHLALRAALRGADEDLARWRYIKAAIEIASGTEYKYGFIKAMVRYVGNISKGLVDAYVIEEVTTHGSPYITML